MTLCALCGKKTKNCSCGNCAFIGANPPSKIPRNSVPSRSNRKQQLAYYCNSLGLSTGVYLVFCPNNIRYPEAVREGVEEIDGVEVRAYLVAYDEETW